MGGDIFGIVFYHVFQFFRIFYRNVNTVGYLETAAFAVVLYVFYKFACQSFLTQIFGYCQIKGYCYVAFIGYGPARNIFTYHLYLVKVYLHVLSGEGKSECSVFFKLFNVILRHSVYGSCYVFHQSAVFLAHYAEIWMYAFFQHVILVYEIYFLHIDFIQNKLSHRHDLTLQRFIACRYGNFLQRLTHDNMFFLTQRKHH